ncbi:MAG: tRNA (adenosine(37)-N6)-threonylcarbamoyltransferase complex transferase subunit TsaD [Chlamydiales bacterium]|nr:tRNA (adenosine(37)-N6)-threonylcarbamoyltransferase complex transferase subunit TsaD [Chlamydiales bacterium]
MLVLGVESTCDETGLALVRDGKEILSNAVATQEELHEYYGGVVPEVACRRHVDVLLPLLRKALCVPLEEVDLIAVANGPGLIGALLVGVNFAQGLALSTGRPLVGVNHIEAHLYSALMESNPPLPALGVVMSGGHTSLVYVQAVGKYFLIGQTRDDAIGEAFDKAAKLLGLPYPGGPHIERLAKEGDHTRFVFKPGRIKGHPYDFSFSGLKTALLYLAKGQNANKNSPLILSQEERKDAAASFQHAAFSDLVEKICSSAKLYRCKGILVGGGVSQNLYFRHLLEEKCSVPIFWPPKGLCLDNGAMIAGLGYHIFQELGGSDCVKTDPRLAIKEMVHAVPTDSICPALIDKLRAQTRQDKSANFAAQSSRRSGLT